MSDPTTYQRITLKLASPFAKYGETQHQWSVKFSLSGTNLTNFSDAEATALALWHPIRDITNGGTSLIGWLHYAPGSDVNGMQASYPYGEYPGTAAAYTGTVEPQQLEVVCLARCPVGVNTKGRAKYLFKHIHDVNQGATQGVLATLGSASATLTPWNDGAGPESLVPVDPTTGVSGGPWTFHTALYTRQLRRGQKAKA